MSKFSIILFIILLTCQLVVAETNIGFLGFEKTDSSSGAVAKSMNTRDLTKISEAYPQYKINSYKDAKKIMKEHGAKTSMELGKDQKVAICKELDSPVLIWGQVSASSERGSFDVTAFLLLAETGDFKQYRFTVNRKSSDRIEVLKKELFDKLSEASAERNKKMLNLAQQYIEVENFTDAVAKLNEYISLDKKNIDAYSLLGYSYLQLKNYDDAINTYNKGIQEVGNDEYLVSGLVDSYFAAQKYTEALDALTPIAESSNNKEYWFKLGRINEKLLESMNAAEAYEKALEIDENYIRAAYQLGLLKYNESLFEEAIPYLEMVSEEYPEDNDIATKLADSYKQSGQTEAAIDNLKDLVEKKPDVLSNYIKLAAAYLNSAKAGFNDGMYDDALEADLEGIQVLEDVKDKFNNDAKIREKLAELHSYNGKIYKANSNTTKQKESVNSAIEIYKSLLDESDEKFEINMKISRQYYSIGQYNSASEYVNKAKQIDPSAFSAYMFDYKIQFKIALNYYNQFNTTKNKIEEGNMYGDELNKEIEKRDNFRKQANSKFTQCKNLLQKAASVGTPGEKNETRSELKLMNRYIKGTTGSFE